MTQHVTNPPDAAALMTSARSFGNYDLAGAIADLIDNSIKAGSRNVSIVCLFNEGTPEVRVLDDGCGMSRDELHAAMRPASTNPTADRSPDDLGRFGWGMKAASFSQCRLLTVVSRSESELSGAVWNLDDLDGWKMGVLSAEDVRTTATPDLRDRDGTEIIWRNCDRLSDNGSLRETEFNELIVHTRNKLALIFHRFIAGTARAGKIQITLNGSPIPAYDPFHRNHDATQSMEEETLKVRNGHVIVRPYILPHYSKLRLSEFEALSGDEGLLKNQGFYIYRNDRLIMYGTWFRLLRHGELSQLVRVSVDIPNSLDDIWKITVDKSDAQLPAVLRSRLKQIVELIRKRSSRVHRSKGGRIDPAGGAQPVWKRYIRNGEIRYEINRDHPLVASLAQEVDTSTLRAALSAIEREFPVEAFMQDSANNPDSIHQSEANPGVFRTFLEDSLPSLLISEGGDMDRLIERLKATEPFSKNWQFVQQYLLEEGWIDGEA